MDIFDLHPILTFQEDNMELDLLCSNSYNNKTNIHSLSEFFNNNVNLSKPFNENFSDTDLLSYFETPFNVDFTDHINISPNPGEVNISALNSEPLSNDNFTNINISPNPEQLLDDNFFETTSNINSSNNYQYNLTVGDYFDDWSSVDAFIHNYCLERGFGYQICRSDKDKDPNDFTIRPQRVKCTILKDVHNHEINPAQVSHVIARYRRFSEEMIQDLKFFMDCKVAPITQLEILKKKYPEHVFHKQDVYNAIYKLRQDNNEKLDTTSLLDILFEKISQDPRWKIFIRHSGSEKRLSGIFWMSPSQQELSLCDIEEAIDKRHEEEIRYCKLTDIKSLHTTIGLPHLSSQFFSSIDRVIVEFLPPLILSMQRFQISQAFTYEGQLTSYLSEDLCSNNTIEDNFIEDVVDEPQTTLKALLIDMDTLKIVETWKICRRQSQKGYIIPIRLYKDEILIKLDEALEKSPVLTAIEPPTNNTTLPHEVNFTLQGLRHIQQSGYKENVQQIVPQRNRFGVAFSTAKTAINVALETKSDNELVQLLKDFISSKKNRNGGVRNNENNQDNNEIVPLQQCLIDEVTDPHVTKIRGAPCKKRIKSAIEISNNKRVMREITSEINNNVQNTNETSRQQRKCLSCGKAGHYQKKCPNRC
ncbi:unnamed protein product [Rhizophagus irregularis]|uniref:CCHC-type domain-containing protein n=1 Tax=Rhizophagus irregularis TaxID=588596 RepID=A0A916E503_9GLOM|nr:unnamed protein product [Rhizophagus irregularis]